MITNLPEGQLHASSLHVSSFRVFGFLDKVSYFPCPYAESLLFSISSKKDCEDEKSSWQEENNKLMG
jgi:hypothetical protein